MTGLPDFSVFDTLSPYARDNRSLHKFLSIFDEDTMLTIGHCFSSTQIIAYRLSVVRDADGRNERSLVHIFHKVYACDDRRAGGGSQAEDGLTGADIG